MYPYYFPPDPVLQDQYDYIVVGAGTAGSVVASRLSEDGRHTVLLLEAGTAPSWSSFIPAESARLFRTECDWNEIIVPQKHALKGFKNRQTYFPGGKMLGGTSSFNGMVYARGHREDYDRWQAAGCEGWSYKDVLPYFIKSERQLTRRLRKTRYHGREGELVVSSLKNPSPIASGFLDACAETGYRVRHDYNGEDSLGCAHPQVHIDNNSRVSAYTAFLGNKVRSRPNLHISTLSTATKIHFSENRAESVAFRKGGETLKARAKREVIVSAGTVHSPRLLLLSGIGPAGQLEELGIPVVADLPVGENLQDHVMLILPYSSKFPTLSERDITFMNLFYYLTGIDGPYSTQINQALAFLNISSASGRPDVEVQLMLSSGFPVVYESLNVDPKKIKPLPGILNTDTERKDYFYLYIDLLHPRSKGTVRLGGASPDSPLLIDPNYLAEREDSDILLEGVRRVQKIMSASVWNRLGGELEILEHTRECLDNDFDSDAYWRCIIQNFVTTDYHQVGTCKMGAAEDTSAVVTPGLKVKGIDGLRVIDLSIVPETLSANPHATAIMIGERGARLILDE